MKFLKNKKQVFAVVASVVCSVFLVAVASFAATTVGNDVSIGGTLATGGAVTVGTDGTGHDVRFNSDTAGAYMLWDESESRLYLHAVDRAANLSPLHAVATLDGTAATSHYYGLQSDITKTGAQNIDDCTAVTAYLNQASNDAFTVTGRFAPLQAILSGTGTVGNITKTGTGAVYAAWIANRGTQTNTDAILAVHNQGTTGSTATSGILLDLNTGVTNAIKLTGTVTTGIAFTGTYSDSAIDFSDTTLNYGGAAGPVMIRAGTYVAPVTSADSGQSGMIRLYGKTTATSDTESSGYYDRGVFVNLQTTGTKGIFPIAGLAEVRESGATVGPKEVHAAQLISHLLTPTSKLASRGGDPTAGMYGAWLKVTGVSNSEASVGSRVAAVWVDNQMNGLRVGNYANETEEYGIFATTGGTVPDAFVGFETTSSGWESLFYFDETSYDQPPVISGDAATSGSKDYHLRVNIDGTMYGIQLYAL